MISANEALAAAEQALNHDVGANDPSFLQWPSLSVQGVHRVHDLAGVPSYWVVGLSSGGHIVGFARVMGDGTVAAIGFTCRTPRSPQHCPTPIFAMTERQVQMAIRGGASVPAGQTSTAPLLVHDGPPGREVWWVEKYRDAIPDQWVFVGTGGVYERPAGTFLAQDPLHE